jgi:hypothetical protein
MVNDYYDVNCVSISLEFWKLRDDYINLDLDAKVHEA